MQSSVVETTLTLLSDTQDRSQARYRTMRVLLMLLLILASTFVAPATMAQESASQTVYIPVSPLQAPIMQGDRIYRQIRLAINLEAGRGAAESRTLNMMPRLQTAYQKTLLDFAQRRLRPRKAPDIAAIAERMQQETDRILGPDIAQVRIDNVSIIR